MCIFPVINYYRTVLAQDYGFETCWEWNSHGAICKISVMTIYIHWTQIKCGTMLEVEDTQWDSNSKAIVNQSSLLTITPYLYRLIGLVGRVFTNGPGNLGSIPGRFILKTLKMVLDTSLLNTQQYKACI